MTTLRFAAEHPERATHVIIVGGYAEARLDEPKIAERVLADSDRMRSDWPKYLEWFFSIVFTEPHSDQAVRGRGALRLGGERRAG